MVCFHPFFASPARAQYQPSYFTERWIEHIHISKNWTERRRFELVLKVLTEQGIESLGMQSLFEAPWVAP